MDEPAAEDAKATPDYRFAGAWGSHGSGEGEFNFPVAVATDADGNVYVAENNHRVQKFDSSGGFLAEWGGQGSGQGQFQFPRGISVGTDGDVYVADSDNHRIQKFDSTGAFIGVWGLEGEGDGQFQSPSGVAVGTAGNVYVGDKFNQRIQMFDPDGGFIAKWGRAGHREGVFDRWVAERDEGKFEYPEDVATDAAGNLYVVDAHNYRIQKFDRSGTFLLMWGIGVDDGAAELQVCTSNCQSGQNPAPAESVSFHPTYVATDPAGDVLVVSYYGIKKFSDSGALITEWGVPGTEAGQPGSPYGLATDPDGNVYVADYTGHRIQKFSPQ